MKKTLTSGTLITLAAMLTGCPPPTNVDNANTNAGDNSNADTSSNTNDNAQAAVPKGTDCSANVIACYDEFARQPVNIICFRDQSRWATTDLTWQLATPLAGIDTDQQEQIAEQAFDLWANASGLTFSRNDNDADITISFDAGDHGDPFPFDGPGNNLGHAFFPGSGSPGSIHLCATEEWGTLERPAAFDLFTAIAHEIGHALGLEHSLSTDALMAPSYAGTITELTDDDVDAIQRLYGSADGAVPSLIEQDDALAEFCQGAIADLTALGDPDSDGDGIPDSVEIFVLNTEPLQNDTDGDFVTDFTEVFLDTTDPFNLNDFNPESVGFDPLDTQNALSATISLDGTVVETFELGDDALISVASQGTTTGGFSILIQNGAFDFTQLNQIVILFDDIADSDGTPIPANDFPGLLQLTVSSPTPIIAQACQNLDSQLDGNVCLPGDATGTVTLEAVGDRLIGSFDFSIDSPLGGTLSASGQLDLRDGFSQLGATAVPDVPNLGG